MEWVSFISSQQPHTPLKIKSACVFNALAIHASRRKAGVACTRLARARTLRHILFSTIRVHRVALVIVVFVIVIFLFSFFSRSHVICPLAEGNETVCLMVSPTDSTTTQVRGCPFAPLLYARLHATPMYTTHAWLPQSERAKIESRVIARKENEK